MASLHLLPRAKDVPVLAILKSRVINGNLPYQIRDSCDRLEISYIPQS
jgi:hypothetical protein